MKVVPDDSLFESINNNQIIMGHNPHAYLASKPPQRRNKDYQARFRNNVFGFSVFKKDCYSRHYYNLVDILQDDHAPVSKYSKIFAKGFFVGCITRALYTTMFKTNHKMEGHMNQIHFNNYANIKFTSLLRGSIKGTSKYGFFLGTYLLIHNFLVDQVA